MNGSDIKKAAITKAKQVANVANNAANGNGAQKRRKGQGLKPIITTEDQQSADSNLQNIAKMNNSRSVAARNFPRFEAVSTKLLHVLIFCVVRTPLSLTTSPS